MFNTLPVKTELLAKEVVDISFKVHKELGPGLLESVYEKCFCYELSQRGISFTRQQSVDIVYGGLIISDGLRIDIMVDNEIIIELKAQENYHPVWEAQLISYLKLSKNSLAFLSIFMCR